MDLRQIIDRYAALRRRLEELDGSGESFSGEAEELDAELVKLEKQLPANYVYPGDEPLPPEGRQ